MKYSVDFSPIVKMRINTKTTDIDLTPEISAYLEKRLASMDKFISGDEAAIVDVEIGRKTRHHQTGDIFRAEININSGSKSFRAVSERADLYSAIDEVKHEILQELRTDKSKSMRLVRRGGQKIKSLMRNLPWRKK